MSDAGSTLRLVRLLHLASPALPIGAFHFSQGLEYAIERGWVLDEAAASAWIAGLAQHVIGRHDLPVLKRLLEAFESDDIAAARRWNAFLLAGRETSELRAEDEHMGAALARVVAEHGCDFTRHGIGRPTYAVVFAFACRSYGATSRETLSTYAWTWLENQVLAAIKLMPLGQSAGQRILRKIGEDLPAIVERAHEYADDDIGIGALMHGVASALHETQYTRLFRS
jgi:urease accessory protein